MLGFSLLLTLNNVPLCYTKTNTMNIITVSRNGVLDTPILVEDNNTAQAVFDNLAEELAEEDVSEVKLHTDSQLDDLNSLIKYKGVEVNWFEGVEVNEYVNL